MKSFQTHNKDQNIVKQSISPTHKFTKQLIQSNRNLKISREKTE